MTIKGQMLTRSSSLLDPQTSVRGSQTLGTPKAVVTENPYQADQQVKYLHLQAEVESLLQQLQILKQQKLASSVNADTANQRQ